MFTLFPFLPLLLPQLIMSVNLPDYSTGMQDYSMSGMQESTTQKVFCLVIFRISSNFSHCHNDTQFTSQ